MELVNGILGIPIITNKFVPPPQHPDDAENIRRFVRHKMADIIVQCPDQGPVGPKPGEVLYTYFLVADTLVMHPDSVTIFEKNHGRAS